MSLNLRHPAREYGREAITGIDTKSQKTQAQPEEEVCVWGGGGTNLNSCWQATPSGASSVMVDSPRLHGRVPELHTTALAEDL